VKRRAWGRLGLVVAATLAALLVAEITARVVAPRARGERSAGWKQAQLDGAPLWTTRTSTEIAGRRYSEQPIDAARIAGARFRILFLGDSFTAGSGLSDLRERFVERVRGALNDRFEGAGGIDTFDAAVGGSMPESWPDDYAAVAPLYRPQIVVTVFFLRDGTSLSTSYAFNRRRFEQIEGALDPWSLRERSALARLVIDRWTARRFSDYLERAIHDAYLGTSAERRTWERQQAALADLAQRCRRDGRSFHLVLFPLLFDLDHYRFADVEVEIERFAREAGIPFFSLTPGFLGQDASRLWVAPDNQHPNALGHEIAARTLLPYLEEAVRAELKADGR